MKKKPTFELRGINEAARFLWPNKSHQQRNNTLIREIAKGHVKARWDGKQWWVDWDSLEEYRNGL